MKKLILFLLLFLPVLIFAQPIGTGGGINSGTNSGGSGGTNSGQPIRNNQNTNNPVFQNPYNNNPYNSNPYLDPSQQNNNFLNNQDQNEDQNRTNRNDPNATDKNSKQNKPEQDLNQFQDLNNPEKKSLNEQEQLEELYKNDPDYIKYLGEKNKTKKETSTTNDENDKDVSLGKQNIYGANFFASNVFDQSDKTPTTPPLDYRLGPGDEVIVTLWGNAELQQNYVIAKDGSIFPRLVGKIYLQGMTFDAASRLISQKFRKIIPQNTSIDVQMGKARTIRITILGEVARQGTYTMSAFNTALNALGRAGGINSTGNLRKIEIKRNGRTVEILDLYRYLQKDASTDDIYLEDNDYIYVDIYEKLVNAEGLFKRPMYYQLTGDEGLRDLVEFAGGPMYNARNSLIHIKTVTNETERYIDIPGRAYFDSYKTSEYSEIILKDGDVVSLKPINSGLKNVVRITGAVNYPDEYEIRTGEKLSAIIDRAGGVASTAYLPRAYVIRGNNPLETDAIKIDLRDLQNNPSQDIEIFTGDKISILSNKDFEQNFFIDVIGNVRRPQRIPYTKNLKLKDVLLLAGGLSFDAENGRIEISNIIDSVDKYTLDFKDNNIKIVSINSNLEIDQASENILIKPMDRIYVRRKSEFLTQDIIQIFGEVNYAGEYPLIQKNERISSVLKRAGGLKKFAFAEGSKLIRQNIGAIVIDLPALLAKPNGKHDLILTNGDVLIIPTMNDIVSVRGAVQSQVNVKYDKDNRNINYYIANAGGYGERPWKKRINVRYQNGKMKSTKNFLLVHMYPKVSPGSTITIPYKPKKESKSDFGQIFSYAISGLTTLATLLILSQSLTK